MQRSYQKHLNVCDVSSRNCSKHFDIKVKVNGSALDNLKDLTGKKKTVKIVVTAKCVEKALQRNASDHIYTTTALILVQLLVYMVTYTA